MVRTVSPIQEFFPTSVIDHLNKPTTELEITTAQTNAFRNFLCSALQIPWSEKEKATTLWTERVDLPPKWQRPGFQGD